MQKTLKYYQFIAPANLALQGLPITKENIELEAKRLQEKDLGILEYDAIIYCSDSNINLDKMNSELDIKKLKIVCNGSIKPSLKTSNMPLPNLEKLVAPCVDLYVDSYNEKLGYDKIKHIDVNSLSSSYGNGIVGADLKALETLIIRSEYLIAGLYGFLHNSPITSGNGYVYVNDSLLELYKIHYSDTPSIYGAIKPISEIE